MLSRLTEQATRGSVGRRDGAPVPRSLRDFIGVPNLNKMKGKKDRVVPLADVKQLEHQGDSIVETATKLGEILNELGEKPQSQNT
jgi:hypothetical protein